MVCPGYWRWAAARDGLRAARTSTRRSWSGRTRRSARPSPRRGPSWAPTTRRVWLRHDGDGAGEDAYEAFLAAGSPGRTPGRTSTPTPRSWSSTPPRSPAGSAARCSPTATSSRWASAPPGWATSATRRRSSTPGPCSTSATTSSGAFRPSCTAARTSSCGGWWPRNCCRCSPRSAARTPTSCRRPSRSWSPLNQDGRPRPLRLRASIAAPLWAGHHPHRHQPLHPQRRRRGHAATARPR